MNIQILRHVRQLFQGYDTDKKTKRAYQRKWIKSIRNLGQNHLLAKKVEKLT
jgi:hypothetical protein